MKNFQKTVIILLLCILCSSCYFATPGSQWAGIEGYYEPGGFGFFYINLGIVGFGFQLGGPLGLGFCAFSEESDIRLGVSQEIPYVPNVGIHVFPFLQAVFQRYTSFCIQILFIYIQIGV